VNIGVGDDITIKELAETVKQVVGYAGEIVFDATKPDGTVRKLMDVGKMSAMNWRATATLKTGIEQAHKAYINQREALL
jgi:GDP-L-fucose synthase